MVMNLPLIVLDTNIALYHLGGRLVTPLPDGIFHISIITEIELLSYPSLSPFEAEQICDFLSKLSIVSIDDSIKNTTISLRKQYRPKLPDAIVAATTQSLNALLLTNDLKLSNIATLPTQSLPLV
jgi:predicted nucleic acid-binding protein